MSALIQQRRMRAGMSLRSLMVVTMLGLAGSAGAAGVRSHIGIEASELRICWESTSNLIYQMQFRSELDTDGWIDLWPPLTATGPMTCITDPVDGPRRFYRVVGPDMVWIPPGTFQMGSPPGEAERSSTEIQHRVSFTQGIWMGRYEVTQAEYLDVIGSNPSYFRNVQVPNSFGTGGVVSNELLHPVEQVRWIDATNYCARLTERELVAGRLPAGYAYRLPTEAEWEYACRAGTTSAFHYGSAFRSGMANFFGVQEYDASVGTINNPSGTYLRRTAEVGSYAPNAFGLYDMHGNVLEWCQDWYDVYPTTPVIDPQGPASSFGRVLRGGSWPFNGRLCRSAIRGDGDPGFRDFDVGFRVVLAAGQP